MSLDLGPRTQEVLHAQLGREPEGLWQQDLKDNAYWDATEDEYGPRHFGFDGEPISMRAWAVLFNAPERLLAQEWLRFERGACWLSTVWMGIDHNHGSIFKDYPGEIEIDTRPWIFETMLFQGVAGWRDVRWRAGEDMGQWRQATFEEALIQHAVVAASVQAGIIPGYGD